MIIALILAILMITGLYLSPKLRQLTDNKALKSIYHILGIFFILSVFPPLTLILFNASPDTAELTGRLFSIFGIPTLIFCGIRRLRSRRENKIEAASSPTPST